MQKPGRRDARPGSNYNRLVHCGVNNYRTRGNLARDLYMGLIRTMAREAVRGNIDIHRWGGNDETRRMEA
jgi:hypothetical protein